MIRWYLRPEAFIRALNFALLPSWVPSHACKFPPYMVIGMVRMGDEALTVIIWATAARGSTRRLTTRARTAGRPFIGNASGRIGPLRFVAYMLAAFIFGVT